MIVQQMFFGPMEENNDDSVEEEEEPEQEPEAEQVKEEVSSIFVEEGESQRTLHERSPAVPG